MPKHLEVAYRLLQSGESFLVEIYSANTGGAICSWFCVCVVCMPR